jgi:hypothetical protein
MLQLIDVVTILGLLAVHFVIKERTFWSSLLFYALPLPVIILIVVLLSIMLTKKWRRFNLIIASLLLLVWLGRSFKLHIPEGIEEKDLEVVFWNTGRSNTFETAINESTDIPDVMVLVEFSNKNIEELKIRYPKYYFYRSQRELFIFSKMVIDIKSDNKSKYGTSVLNFETAGVNFYAVDAQGSLDVPREWGLTYINQSIKEHNNTIVLGDFNTPYESIYLKQLKKDFNHAFSKKGNGFKETWFYNLPLLCLDYIWVSKDLKILKSEKIFSSKSDHSMLKTVIKR